MGIIITARAQVHTNWMGETITNLSQLQRLSTNYAQQFRVQLDGIVLWQNADRSQLVLHDETGTERLQLGTKLPFVAGHRIAVTGSCRFSEGQYLLGPVPLVDNDGTHSRKEQSASVFLQPGLYPIKVSWFNTTSPSSLEVHYSGPNLPRQKIPGDAWRRRVDGTSSEGGHWTHGLNYRCFEGVWDHLPEFNSVQPVKQGTVLNCDLSAASRTTNVAIEFTGYLDIPRKGAYTFSLISDDGSQLILDPSHIQYEIKAETPLPEPNRAEAYSAMHQPKPLRWMEVEGTVDFLSETMSGLSLFITSGAIRLSAEIADSSRIVPSLFLKSRVRILGLSQGVYTADGQWTEGKLLVAGRNQITILEAPPGYWTRCPTVKIKELTVSSPPPLTNSIVRLIGRVSEMPAGNRLVLEDEGGRLLVEPAQPMIAAKGQWLEVLGQCMSRGSNCSLRSEVCRLLPDLGYAGKRPLSVLTSSAEIKGLKREEALRKHPVRIRGVVVSTHYGSGIVIHDATSGVYALSGVQLEGASPKIGDFLEVEGVTDPGSYAPQIIQAKGRRLGIGEMPIPIKPTRDQLLNGSLDAQYVEIQGILSGLETNNNSLFLITCAGKTTLQLTEPMGETFSKYENALVRVRGCLFPLHNAAHQVEIGVMAIDNVTLSVDEPAPSNPFALPGKTTHELLLFDSQASVFNRVKIAGLIVHQQGEECYLMNGSSGLRFFPKMAVPLVPGDEVEVVGFPELEGASPVLREAMLRTKGHSNLPAPVYLSETNLLSSAHDATLVCLVARLLGQRTNLAEQLLELQTGQRTYLARLANDHGRLPSLAPGSQLELTGVYSGQGGNRAERREIDSFELLLNSSRDIKVLKRPPWWTLKHTLAAGFILATVLLLAAGWIRVLRQQVESRTQELKAEIAEHKRTEAKLEEKTSLLEDEITERRAIQDRLEEEIEGRKQLEVEKERINKELLVSSRRAGMADIATGVLHNVGNVLNSVNVSATLLGEKVRKSKAASVGRVASLLSENRADLGAFITQDEKGKKLVDYLNLLAEGIAGEQQDMQRELSSLQENVDHIKEIVTTQQNYARVSGVIETVPVCEVVEDALKVHAGAYARHNVRLERTYKEVPPITTDKHKVLQILVNLFHNAKYACDESGRADKQVAVRIAMASEDRVKIEVVDNGIGILAENLTKIFVHGFTTRKDGHGFGLHSGANAAKELGGCLTAYSEGPLKGAMFTLELPLQRTSLASTTPVAHPLSNLSTLSSDDSTS